jgi:hypothetical protein
MNNLQTQISILREVAQEYAGHTIENIIMQIESRLKYKKK